MATYTPVNKTYTLWNKDPVNSVDITNFAFTDNANVAHHITYSSDWSAGAGADWAPGVDYTGNQTLISKTKTYVSHVGDKNTATAATSYFKGHTPFTQAYTTSSGDKLRVDSTNTVGQLVTIGMAITGGGFTGQTVSAFSATSGWMVLNTVSPTIKPAVSTALTFTDPFPPTLKLVSTASLYTGMIINGNGFTAGQTIVSIGTDSTVVASADPNTGIYASAIVTFQPPAYVLKINNIVGLSTGWYVETSGSSVYSQARSIVSTSGTQYLIMSGDVGYAAPTGDIKFISDVNKMITLAPNTSATWVLYYSANNATLSNNLVNITISGTQLGSGIQKEINNLVSINQAPSVSNIQPPTGPGGGGGGGSSGGYTVTSETVSFPSDNADINSTMTTTTVTDSNGNVVSVTISSTPAINFSVATATDGVAQAAAAVATDAATAVSVAAAIAAADATAAAAAAQATADAAAAAVGAVDGAANSSNPDSGNVGTSTTTGGGTTTSGEGPAPSGGEGGTSGCTCYLAGSRIAMADGSFVSIEDVKVGDWVQGAFGEINQILALMHVKLGDRKMYKINQEHDTTYEEIHISADKKMHSIDTDATYNEYSLYWNCILGDGTEHRLMNIGVAKERLHTLTTGTKLQTITGPRVVTSVAAYDLPSDTTLYNFVLSGSHTFFVNEYAVASWPREDNFDYDQWSSIGIELTVEDYRNPKPYQPWTYK